MEWSLPVTTGSIGRGKGEALTPFLESSDSTGMSLFTQKTGKMTYLCRDKIPITCQTWASDRKLRHWALLLYSNVHARGGRASLCSRSSPRSHSQVRKIRKIRKLLVLSACGLNEGDFRLGCGGGGEEFLQTWHCNSMNERCFIMHLGDYWRCKVWT